MPHLDRRAWLALAGSSLFGQGVANRGVTAAARAKPSGKPWLAKFQDVAAAAGLRAPVIYGGVERKTYILEATGCGAAFIDYDSDGWLDIFLLTGSRLDGAPDGATNRLYKNNRDGTFTDVTERAGLTRAGWFCAVTAADYNNDGHVDLFLTGHGECVLYRNNGDGTFTDATKEAGLFARAGELGGGCTFLDYDRDGRLDLFVANYLELDLATAPKPGDGANCTFNDVPVNCGPRGLKTSRCRLFRNNGDGTFTDISNKAGIDKVTGSYAMTAVAADFDNDGWPDILVACDSTPSFLLRNQRDGTFKEEGIERGIALSDDGQEQAGMGLAVGDHDLDGDLDIFKTHFANDTHGLFRNDGKGMFAEITAAAGIGVETRYVGWGAGMTDLDNDGHPDLFLVTGGVYPETEGKPAAHPQRSPRLVFRNLGNGRFEEILGDAGPGIGALHSSRGCAVGDFDNDGDMDILVVNLNEPPSLLRNDLAGTGHWLKMKLEGTVSNRSAIGARATVRYTLAGKAAIQAQEVQAQSSFYSVNDFRLHYGLGAATSAAVTVRWPNGGTEYCGAVAVDQLITVREGAGIVKRERFKSGSASQSR